MIHHDENTIKTRAPEVTALARELWVNDEGGESFTTAIYRATKLVTTLADFADAWDAQSAAMRDESEAYEASDPMSQCDRCNEWIEDAVLETGCPSCHAAELDLDRLLYVPSALTPAEQRAMDKALYQLARGIEIERVGRFWMVPSRTSGGTVYRTTGESCSCAAGQAGKPICWHRFAVGIVAEQRGQVEPAPLPILSLDGAAYEQLLASADEMFG